MSTVSANMLQTDRAKGYQNEMDEERNKKKKKKKSGSKFGIRIQPVLGRRESWRMV